MKLLVTLTERSTARVAANLTPKLRRLYDGDLRFSPPPKERPRTVVNFVKTIDGIISFSDVKGQEGGGYIGGFSEDDRFVMGLLRASSDAVLVGANTLRIEPSHKWTPEHIAPEYGKEWQALRKKLGKPEKYLNVFLTASGEVPLDSPVFCDQTIQVVVMTSAEGAERIRKAGGRTIALEVVPSHRFEEEVLRRLRTKYQVGLLLVEGGPTVFGNFMSKNLIDEMFLTEAPQIAGNDRRANRPTLVQKALFTPQTAPWWEIVSEKAAGSYRFFRYRRR